MPNSMAMKNADYSDIINRIVEGESFLFEKIMRNFNPYLNKIGRTYGFNHEDTQDLMQETYMKVYLNLAKFENRSTLKSWVTRIMLNNCYHKSSKQERELNYERMAAALSTEWNVTNWVLNAELGNVLEHSLQEIPLDYRMVFILREKNGLSVAETADVMEISSANVKVRLNRAKKMLKKMIATHYTQEDIYEFQVVYCDQMVHNVLEKIDNYN